MERKKVNQQKWLEKKSKQVAKKIFTFFRQSKTTWKKTIVNFFMNKVMQYSENLLANYNVNKVVEIYFTILLKYKSTMCVFVNF